MLEWVLETHYRDRFAPGSIAESSIIVREAGESQLIELMNVCQSGYPLIKVFSLPRLEPDRHIELGVRGDPAQVESAMEKLRELVRAAGFPCK